MSNTQQQCVRLNKRDVRTIIAALWEASLWQESITDTHYRALDSWNRTPALTRVARRAEQQRERYTELHDRIIMVLREDIGLSFRGKKTV